MKLFGSSKGSRHTGAHGASHGGAGREEEHRSRKGRHVSKKKSARRKALTVTVVLTAVIMVVGAGAVVWYKTSVKPPDVTGDLNLPTDPVQDPVTPGNTDEQGTAAPGKHEPGDFVLSDDINGQEGKDETPTTGRKDKVYTFVIAARDKVAANTDAIIVARFDAVNYTLDVTSIPRDTLVNVTYKSKLVSGIYAYGKEEGFMEGIRDLIGFEPDFYAIIKLSAIEKLIDAIGGVKYNVPRDMDYDDDAQDLHIHFKKGVQTLNGKKAVEYMRFRKGYSDADIGRIHAQQDFLMTMAKQLLANADKVPVDKLVDIFINDVNTSLTAGNCLWFAKEFLKMDSENVSFYTMPGNYNDYVKGRSCVTVTLDEWLTLINEHISPFYQAVTEENLDVLTRNESGKLISTTGEFADKKWAA